MYKKRFAKWGFQKNSKRSMTSVPHLMNNKQYKRVSSKKHSPLLGLESLPMTPDLDDHDESMLSVLTSVRTFSVAFYESVRSRSGIIPTDDLCPEQPQEISFTCKLVIGLLDRGYGDLAGRMARKTFLLLEDMLKIEGPAVLWNLLDLLNQMLAARQERLFEILLAHLTALVDGQISRTHPLLVMLRRLRRFVATLRSTTGTSGGSVTGTPSSLSSTSSPGGEDPWRAVSMILEQAWSLNAEVLFNNFDGRLFHLYCRVHWDLCSFTPPVAIVDAAKRWVKLISTRQVSGAATYVGNFRAPFNTISAQHEHTLCNMFVPGTDPVLPQWYDVLRKRSLAALKSYGNSVLSCGTADRNVLLRTMAGLVAAESFEESPYMVDWSSEPTNTMNVPHSPVSHLAFMLRTLIDLVPEEDSNTLGIHLNTVERARAIIALLEYARGEISPQVLQEMWLLADALLEAGRYSEAVETRNSAIRRLDIYVQGISTPRPSRLV